MMIGLEMHWTSIVYTYLGFDKWWDVRFVMTTFNNVSKLTL